MSSNTKSNGRQPSNKSRRPSVRFSEQNQTIFNIQDDVEDEEEADLSKGLNGDKTNNKDGILLFDNEENEDDDNKTGSDKRKGGRAYGLKSTQSSREAEFDADDSDVEEEELQAALRSTDELNADVSSRSQRNGFRLMDHLPPAVNRARQSISDATGHDFRESLRRTIESEELPDWLRRGAGILDSTWNMSNSILGAGVVGLPYSLRASGCFAGIGLILLIAMLTDWTIRLIVLNAKLSGRTTYIDIMDHCFGKNGRVAVSIFQGAFAFGGMCAFIVVIGDTIPHVLSSIIPSLEHSFLTSRAFIMIVCTMSISFPLSLYREIESLSRASAIALISMVLIIITVIVRGPAMPAELKGDPSLRFTVINISNVVRSIAVISFAFVCHHNSLLIYGSLKEPSMDRFGKVTHYSTAIAAAALVSMSLAGYWTFTDKTLGNVLNNFPPDDTMVNIARFCFGMNMLTTWPLELFVAREVIETYFFQGEYDHRRHIIVTSALTAASLIVSLLATDLGVVLEVTGGLSATALAFIFPAICYLKLCDQEPNQSAQNARREGNGDYAGIGSEDQDDEDDDALHREVHGDISADDVELPLRPGAQLRRRGAELSGKETPWYLTTKPLAVACTAFGCFVLVVSTITTIKDALTGSGGPPIPSPDQLPGSAAGKEALESISSSISSVLSATASTTSTDTSGGTILNTAIATLDNTKNILEIHN
ncbi:hypothetical protein L7F22_019306 [Adiantum nelumboides]|nr:hypothetical protein [Adiantum nelumboides]